MLWRNASSSLCYKRKERCSSAADTDTRYSDGWYYQAPFCTLPTDHTSWHLAHASLGKGPYFRPLRLESSSFSLQYEHEALEASGDQKGGWSCDLCCQCWHTSTIYWAAKNFAASLRSETCCHPFSLGYPCEVNLCSFSIVLPNLFTLLTTCVYTLYVCVHTCTQAFLHSLNGLEKNCLRMCTAQSS